MRRFQTTPSIPLFLLTSQARTRGGRACRAAFPAFPAFFTVSRASRLAFLAFLTGYCDCRSAFPAFPAARPGRCTSASAIAPSLVAHPGAVATPR